MSAPIEEAYAAFGASVASALVGVGFLPAVENLEIDPPSSFEPNGTESEVVTVAAMLKLSTGPARTFLGGPTPRYAVERRVRIELGACGADHEARKAVLLAALGALILLPESDPTLGGKAERLAFVSSDDDDLPPNGAKALPEFTIRVRSSDPLGLNA